MAFLAEIGIRVASKVSELFVEPIWRRISYPFKYKANIRKLRQEVNELQEAKKNVKHSVEEARRRLEEIEDGVAKWLDKVDEFVVEADKVLEDEDTAQTKGCFMGLCPDFKLRYKISRAAEGKTEYCVNLRGKRNFIKVSYPPAPGGVLLLVKDYHDFESRTSVSEKVVKALTNPDVSMVGVYGMGGVGKTTLVKKVAAKLKEEKLFHVMLMASITENVNLRTIQGEIGDGLHFKFGDAETIPGRANQLYRRLKQEEKILIILDDIWKGIKLEELGIPHGDDHKGCKILMTSRDLNVLSREMDTQENFRLQELDEEEAWELFAKTVGNAIKDPSLQSTARQVAKRCAGLPVLLVAVAKALRNRNLHAWKDALVQLERIDNNEMDKQVYSALQLSYNFLRSDEIKKLFLLCGQEGYSIHISDMLKYTFGLALFGRNNRLQELRSRLYTLLDDLKASSLLEGDDGNKRVKMHDVIKKFAISFACKNHHFFIVSSDSALTEWPEQNVFEKFTKIFLHYCNIPELPEVLACPKLEFFSLETDDPTMKIPNSFFKRTKNLKVLDLTGMHLSMLPSSITCLDNLRTLCLDQCVLEDISRVGELKKLQVLSFIYSQLKSGLPREIGQLTALCLLDLSNCQGL